KLQTRKHHDHSFVFGFRHCGWRAFGNVRCPRLRGLGRALLTSKRTRPLASDQRSSAPSRHIDWRRSLSDRAPPAPYDSEYADVAFFSAADGISPSFYYGSEGVSQLLAANVDGLYHSRPRAALRRTRLSPDVAGLARTLGRRSTRMAPNRCRTVSD